MKKALWIAALTFLVISCATSPRPTPQQLTSADYGPPPSSPEKLIHAVVGPRLIDPNSATYTLSEPKKGTYNMGGRVYGWRVCGTINSKNRFGGYAGPEPIFALIYNDKVIRLLFKGLVIPDSFIMGIEAGVMSGSHSSESFCKD